MAKPPENADRRSPGGGRRAAFVVIALLLPVALLALVEFALRAADAAPRQPLFIQTPKHPEFSLPNPRVVERFFSRPEAAPNVSVETGYFRTQRPDSAFRLITMGGSSAAGFPFGYGASLAGMLEQRLRRTFPEREIEVITTAMSAINSYSLLDYADEVIALEPDGVLIYAGHNEYVGVLGVGSAFSSSQSPALTRLIVSLRRLTLYRVLESLLAPSVKKESAGSDDGTLMARVAAERRIATGSSLYERGVDQFSSNMSALLSRYRDAGIPVYIGTLVSNEKDQAPFISARDDESWEAELGRGEGLLVTGRASQAVELARSLLDEDPSDARARYLLARSLMAEGDAEGARAEFIRARDEDQLRFRAPSRFNEVIRELAARYDATVVEVEAAFRGAAEDGIIGYDLITEHLHPNIDGYFLLANAYHDALLSDGLPGPATRALDADRARREVPVSAIDRYFAGYKLARLMGHWPFTDTPTEPELPEPEGFEEQLAQALFRQEVDWVRAHRRLKDHYRQSGDQGEYLRVSLILADAFPYVPAAQIDAGRALMNADRSVQAIRYLHRGAVYEPGRAEPLLILARAYLDSGLADAAVQTLERAERIQPGSPALRRLMEEAVTARDRPRP